MSVIDEMIVIDKANRQLQIDRVNDEILDEIIVNNTSYHFAKQKDLTGETEIVADNSVQEPIIELSVEGNTFQQTYEGRNKFNVDEWVNALETAQNPDGALSVRGEVIEYDGRSCYRLDSCSHRTVWFYLPEGVHGLRLTRLANGGGTYTASYGQIRYTDGGIYYFQTGSVRDTWETISVYNANKTIERFGIFFSPTDGTDIYFDLNSIMAEDSSTPTAYEPYVGGIPSPNAGQVVIKYEDASIQDVVIEDYFIQNDPAYVLCSGSPIMLPEQGKTYKVKLNGEWNTGNYYDIICIGYTVDGVMYGTDSQTLANGDGQVYEVQVDQDFYIGIGETNTGIPSGQEQFYWDTLMELGITLQNIEPVEVERIKIPAYPQEIINANDKEKIIDYTDAVMSRLAEDTNYRSGGVTGVFMVKLPDELIGQEITFSTDGVTETYSVGLIDGTNWLFGNSVELASPTRHQDITTKDYTYIYINGALGEGEAVQFFSTYTIYAKKVVDKDNKIVLQLSGVNLLDPSLYKKCTSWGVTTTPVGDVIYQTGTGTKNSYSSAVSANADGLIPIPDTWRGKTVTLFAYGIPTRVTFGFYGASGSDVKPQYANLTSANNYRMMFDLSADKYERMIVQLIFIAGVENNNTIRLMVVEGDYSSQDLPYEPYIEPQTVEIPKEIDLDGTIVPLNFAKIEDVADTLVIDNINKSVIYNSNIAHKEFSGQEYFGRTFKVYDYGGEPVLDYNTIAFGGSLSIGNLASVVCNYAKGLASFRLISYLDLGVCVGESNRLFFRLPREVYGATTESTNDELSSLFKQWVKSLKDSGNPMYAFWVKRTPTSYDLTNTDFGQRLLALEMPKGTGILKFISSKLPVSKTDLSYWRQIIPNETLESEI